jgi:hypothetical protein
MRQLIYSRDGFRRSMQMSSCSVYVFVEGPTDRFVYGEIPDSVCRSRNLRYNIVVSRELGAQDDGKAVLLDFHDYLTAKGALTDTLNGKITVAIFVVDKDVDDISGKARNCPHVVYTQMYELENYLFHFGDLHKAAAIAGRCDRQSVSGALANNAAWCRQAGELWRHWVTLCLYSAIKGTGCFRSYGEENSPLNPTPRDPVDMSTFEDHCCALAATQNLGDVQFDREIADVERIVNDVYAKDAVDSIFKGKWYATFMTFDAGVVKKADKTRYMNSLYAGLQSSLKFSDTWTDHFRGQIEAIVARVFV